LTERIAGPWASTWRSALECLDDYITETMGFAAVDAFVEELYLK